MVVGKEGGFGRLPGARELYRAGAALARGEPLGAIRHARRTLDLAPEEEHRTRASASGLMAIAFWGSGDLQAAHSAWAECAAGLRRARDTSRIFGRASGMAGTWRAPRR